MVLDKTTFLLLGTSKLFTCKLPRRASTPEHPKQASVQDILDLGSDGVEGIRIVSDLATSVVCVAVGKVVRIGANRKTDDKPSKSRFLWKEITTDEEITSIACNGDVLALGEKSGQIRLYYDIPNFLEKDLPPTESSVSWHQSSVNSLQFTVDGKLHF